MKTTNFRFLLSAVLLLSPSQGCNVTTTCPEYVAEGRNLSCSCQGNCGFAYYLSVQYFTWHWGTSTVSSDSLVKTNVSRQDNGTRFECRLQSIFPNGPIPFPVSKVYILQVSYGPTDDHLKIDASGPLTVGSNSTAVLTCTASEVNPAPEYTWLNGPCRGVKENKCSFVPLREHDGQTVACRATSRVSLGETAVTFTSLDVKYPPIEPPVIQGYTPGQMLEAGKILSCTVKGGKPPVQSVHFSCDGHPDQPDSAHQSYVASTVFLEVSRITKESAECTCTALWQPQPDLYSLNSTIHVLTKVHKVVEGPHLARQIDVSAIVGGVIVTLAVVAAAAVAVICWRRQRRRCENPQPGSDQVSEPPSRLVMSNTSRDQQGSVNSAYLEPEPYYMSTYGEPVEDNIWNHAQNSDISRQ